MERKLIQWVAYRGTLEKMEDCKKRARHIFPSLVFFIGEVVTPFRNELSHCYCLFCQSRPDEMELVLSVLPEREV